MAHLPHGQTAPIPGRAFLSSGSAPPRAAWLQVSTARRAAAGSVAAALELTESSGRTTLGKIILVP